MATMNVSLPDQMKQWVEEQVASGRYGNASDVIRDVLRKEQDRAKQQLDLDRIVSESLDSPRLSRNSEELMDLVMDRAQAAIDMKEPR